MRKRTEVVVEVSLVGLERCGDRARIIFETTAGDRQAVAIEIDPTRPNEKAAAK